MSEVRASAKIVRYSYDPATASRDCEELTRVYRQLHKNAAPITPEFLRLASRENLFVAKNGRIVGTALLTLSWRFSGLRGHVDDVVVDERYREQGIGRGLMEKLLEYAQSRGVRYLDLTCQEHRHIARRLYASLDFEEPETGLFRRSFG